MKIILSLLICLANIGCQSSIPYAARPGITDYWHPLRAKVEDSGKLMTCTGYMGRDEPSKLHWLMREFTQEEASFLSSIWYHDSEPAMVHSGLMIMENDSSKENPQGQIWELWMQDPEVVWAMEPNRREWRATRSHNEFEEVVIIGRGGPWKTRPDQAFPVLEEVSPGEFTLDGIPLMQPYWSIMDWRGEGSPFSDS